MPGGIKSLRQYLKVVDVILEVIDARLPAASRYPNLEQIIGSKQRVLVLTRVDLADRGATARWLARFRAAGIPAVAINARSGAGVRALQRQLAAIARARTEQLARKGLQPQPLRAIAAGIPNVGKSSLLNRLAGRGAARTGDRPGITRGPQWIRLGGMIELLDTPGVLPSRQEEAAATIWLGAIGCLPEGRIATTTLATHLGAFLLAREPAKLAARYGINPQEETLPGLLEAIGRRRGYLQSGGIVDQEKTAVALVHDFREGLLGRYTLEEP
jgi:ribosome biogenesis GTPase A